MAKAAKVARGAKSAAVRKFLESDPKASLRAVVDGVRAKGIKISASLVNRIKYSKKRRKSRRRTASASQAVTVNGSTPTGDLISLASLMEAKKAAERMGGIAELQRAADALAKLGH